MNKSNRSVQGLAEISLRVHDFDTMRRFYEEVIGLQVLQAFDDSSGKSVFYTFGESNEVQNMALFEETMIGWSVQTRSPQIDPKQTTLHHLAFSISLDAFESERKRIAAFGIKIVHIDTVNWGHARMFYFYDPEGN